MVDAAKELHISESYYGFLENGRKKPSEELAKLILFVMGVSKADIDAIEYIPYAYPPRSRKEKYQLSSKEG